MEKPFMLRSFDMLTTHHERLGSNDIPYISYPVDGCRSLASVNRIHENFSRMRGIQ
jgi:hypothetical protein